MQRSEQNLPDDYQYTMVMPQRDEHPNAVRLMHTAPLNDWSHGWPRTHKIWSRLTSATSSTANLSITTATTATTTSVQQQRLHCATDLEVMGKNDFNRTRRSRRQTSTAFTTNVATTTTSPKSTSSNTVQIVQPSPPTVIVLTVESIEDLMMTDVQEQKAASDNDTSAQQDKAAKGKRKHVATGNPRGRPTRDPSKDGDRDKGQGLA
jgi:hypothetical protein